jgi:hypothetical protein
MMPSGSPSRLAGLAQRLSLCLFRLQRGVHFRLADGKDFLHRIAEAGGFFLCGIGHLFLPIVFREGHIVKNLVINPMSALKPLFYLICPMESIFVPYREIDGNRSINNSAIKIESRIFLHIEGPLVCLLWHQNTILIVKFFWRLRAVAEKIINRKAAIVRTNGDSSYAHPWDMGCQQCLPTQIICSQICEPGQYENQ